MLEPDLCSSRVLSPFPDECGDEELSVLPRHTKVIVTGNNRTKSVLVGLQGVVKKAVGLGGWHWLVLKNGVEVKLQRNALRVLEPPTGNEDDDHDLDNSSSSSGICDSVEFHKFTKPRVRDTRPWASSTSAKLSNRNSYREVESSIRSSQLRVNLANLGTSSLWRYWRRYNLGAIHPNPSREQLVNAVQRHFISQQLDEVQVVVGFIHAAKRLRKIDAHE